MTVTLCYQHLRSDNGLTMLTTPAGDAKVEKETVLIFQHIFQHLKPLARGRLAEDPNVAQNQCCQLVDSIP